MSTYWPAARAYGEMCGTYLDLANARVNGSPIILPASLPAGFPFSFFASSGDEKPFYREDLRNLSHSIEIALTRTTDRETRAHLSGARDQIAKILDPKFASNQSGMAGGLLIFGDEWKHWAGDATENCWPDYKVLP